MPTPGTQVGGNQPTRVASGNITVNLPQAATAGDLLLVVLVGHSGSASLTPAITTPAGWSRVGGNATTSTTSDKTILGNYYKVAAGGETSIAFTMTNCGAGSSAVATEWAGPIAVPLDQNGTAATSGASSTGRTDSSGALVTIGPFDLNFGVHVKVSVAATGTPTSSWGAGLTGLYVDPWNNQLSIDIAVSTSSGVVGITPSDAWTANGAVLGTITKGFSFFLTPTGTGSLTLSASGSGSASPSASGSLSLGGSGAASAAPSASASVSLAGASSAAASNSATASLALGAAAVGQAPVTATGSVTLTATASQAASESGSASLTLAAAAVASFPPATASVSLAATANGSVAASATGSIALSVAGTSSAQLTAAASITLAGVASIVAAATSTATLSLTGAGAVAAQPAASGSITLAGVSTAQASNSASAFVSLTATAARPVVIIRGTAVAAWGGLGIDAAGTVFKLGVVAIDWGALVIDADNSPQDHDGILVCAWGE